VDAENWISHMEKIFDVIGCEDAFKTRLAMYKFEGNALSWWKAYKQAKGGDAWLVTVTWTDFKKVFFLQFFPRAEQERLKREYHSFFQTNTETSTESTLNHLMCMSYTDVAQVTNAARNYEILYERDDDDTERPDKRGVTIMVSEPGYKTVGSKDLTCEDWMVNTRTDADLSTAVQNALQTLLPQIRTEIREEFCTSSGPSDAGGNPPSHFLRLAGFLGTAAGTEEEQAKNFQWGLRRSTLNHLMCMSYTDVAQVANAARNYEILHERDDEDTELPDKRQRSGDRHQPTSQQSSHRSHGHHNDRHGSDRRGGSDNHRSSNNNYSGSNNRNSDYGPDQRNRGHQSNRSANFVAKAFMVFNIIRQEMKETYHVTFSEDGEAISKSSTKGDDINFKENISFPDDEFIIPRNTVSECSGNDSYFLYVPTYDPLFINNITVPDPITPSDPITLTDPITSSESIFT
nr:hypothetical protein [Tanacetum cinerariifolium]